MKNDYLTNKRRFAELNTTKIILPFKSKKNLVCKVNINKLLNDVKDEKKTMIRSNLLILSFFITIIGGTGIFVFL
tara:strand:+ start:71 stop:295 length:225 start_codon:yes stop_codon:yes gene_type:complete